MMAIFLLVWRCGLSDLLDCTRGIFDNECFYVVSRNDQVEPGVWELQGTLNVKVGSTVKIIGQVG